MKKIIFVIICILLTGCSNENIVDDDSNRLYEQYLEYEKKLVKQQDYQVTSDEFMIRLVVNKIDDNNNRYDIIIDNPKINMYHLQAIAKVSQDENESLPSLGVNLSGITKENKFDVLIYLTFYSDEECKKKEERYLKLYGDATR